MEPIKSSFVIRKNKQNQQGLCPIYFRISVSGRRVEVSLKKYVKPENWDSKRQRLKGRLPKAVAINTYLDQIKSELIRCETELIKEGKSVTSESLKQKLKGDELSVVTLLEYFRSHNDKVIKLINNGYSNSTLKKYITCYKHVNSFLEEVYSNKNFLLSSLDIKFIKEFEFYLKTKENPCSHNSALKYIDNLRKVVNEAIQEGIIHSNPFNLYSESYEKKDPEYLNSEELQIIENKDILNERVSRVKDVFIFCCYTGLSYVDVEKLRKSDIQTDAENEKWLVIKRKKTTEPASIMLMDIPLSIIKKYEDDPETRNGNLLPVISNQKTNAYLKEVAGICDIKKNLTFHMSRHTFATTVALENGVPIETVQKILGHKDARSTAHYARVTKNKIGQEMKKLREKIK